MEKSRITNTGFFIFPGGHTTRLPVLFFSVRLLGFDLKFHLRIQPLRIYGNCYCFPQTYRISDARVP